jgi:hypothetical protein
MTNTPSSEAKQFYKCPLCEDQTAFKVPQVYESKFVKVDCYDMKCGTCNHVWLPSKEEARIDLEVRQALEQRVKELDEANEVGVRAYNVLRDQFDVLEAKLATAREALKYCCRVTYGTEISNSREENNEILVKHFFNSQDKAREALESIGE